MLCVQASTCCACPEIRLSTADHSSCRAVLCRAVCPSVADRLPSRRHPRPCRQPPRRHPLRQVCSSTPHRTRGTPGPQHPHCTHHHAQWAHDLRMGPTYEDTPRGRVCWHGVDLIWLCAVSSRAVWVPYNDEAVGCGCSCCSSSEYDVHYGGGDYSCECCGNADHGVRAVV